MAGFGERLNKIDRRVEQLEDWRHESDKRFEAFMAKMDMYIEKTDRQLAEDRVARAEMRQEMNRMNEKIDEKMDGINRHVQNLTVAAMVGIGAIALSVVGFVIATLLSR